MNHAGQTGIPPATTATPGPVRLLLELFSSIWFGVMLLTVLFVYCSVGSAGIPVHPLIWRPDAWLSVREVLELTEYDWFNWWPFTTLVVLVCLALVTTTIRRVRLDLVNLGVWLTHGGLIVLVLGSAWYFSTKVEGDVAVARRRIVIEAPGHDPVSITAMPGRRASLGDDEDAWTFSITSIDPSWEILTGDAAGRRAFSISVMVRRPDGTTFIRQLLAGFPGLTEDIVRGDDPQQPWVRVKKETGRPLMDETLRMSLAYDPRSHFHVMHSAAVYLRELDDDLRPATPWIDRPIDGLPRYHDHVAIGTDAWQVPGAGTITSDPLHLSVGPTAARDPLPGTDLVVTGFVRQATMVTRPRPGGERPNPIARVRLAAADGRGVAHQLAAMDPARSVAEGGLLVFRAVGTTAGFDDLLRIEHPVLRLAVPDLDISIEVPIDRTLSSDPGLVFTPLEGTPYAWRARSLQDDLEIAGRTLSVLILEIRRGDAEPFVRWVFDDESLTRDLRDEGEVPGHGDSRLVDDAITTTYEPGRTPVPVTLVAGPVLEALSVITAIGPGEPAVLPVIVGEAIDLGEGVTLTVESFWPRATEETRPLLIPPPQRDPDAGMALSMLQVAIGERSWWLPWHRYVFDGEDDAIRRFLHRPTVVTLPDGRNLELLFSRRRRALPAPVVLDDFVLDAHVGGFTGQTGSIRNWTSVVRFGREGAWSTPVRVSVNDPQRHGEFWFFQSQWDPPEPPRFEGDVASNGLNYTVLGVGNRNGVLVQLSGCCIAVTGMIWAFYLKPVLKRRRQDRAMRAAEGAR